MRPRGPSRVLKALFSGVAAIIGVAAGVIAILQYLETRSNYDVTGVVPLAVELG
jgi:hypothetical protein